MVQKLRENRPLQGFLLILPTLLVMILLLIIPLLLTVVTSFGQRDPHGNVQVSRIDTEKVTATVKHGVLTIHLPKHPESQPKSITVKAQ